MSKTQTGTAPAVSDAMRPLIEEWQQLEAWLETAAKREMELRRKIADHFFVSFNEGTNTVLTPDGFEVKVIHKINRTLDVAALDSVMPQLAETYRSQGVLIDFKPVLVKSGFNVLPDDQRKIFQQALTESPGAPALTIVKLTPEQLAAKTAPSAAPPVSAPVAPAPSQGANAAPVPPPAAKAGKSAKKKTGGKKKR